MASNGDAAAQAQMDAKKLEMISALQTVSIAMRNAANICDAFLTQAGAYPGTIANVLGTNKRASVGGVPGSAGPGRKPRKDKKIKDPNAPKRPASAYLLFQNDMRARMKQEFPEAHNHEIVAKIGERWAQLSELEKKVYNDRYKAEVEVWEAAKQSYQESGAAEAFAAAHAGDSPPALKKQRKNAKADATTAAALAAVANQYAPGTSAIPAGLPPAIVPLPAAPAPAPVVAPAPAAEDSSEEDSSDDDSSEDSDTDSSEDEPPKKSKKKTPEPEPKKSKKSKKEKK